MPSANPVRNPQGDPEVTLIARALRLESFFPEFTGALSVTISMGSAGPKVAALGAEALIGEVALLCDGLRIAPVRAIIPRHGK